MNITVKSGNFDILAKIIRNWTFDRWIRIEGSKVAHKISDKAFVGGDLASILGSNIDMSAIIEDREKKKLAKIPSSNHDALIEEHGTIYRVSKGAVSIQMTRIPQRTKYFNMPDVNSFHQIGSDTLIGGKDYNAFLGIARNQDSACLCIDAQDELFKIKFERD